MPNHPNRSKRAFKLTKAQVEILIDCADFVLAGEWPWDDRRPETLHRAMAVLLDIKKE